MRDRIRIDTALGLLVFLLAAQFAVTLAHCYKPLITDEFYWTGKARYFAEHGWFPPIDAEALKAERGEVWGVSDWRPQLYTLFLALCSFGDFDDPARSLRLRATIVHFLLLAVVLICLFRIAVRAGVPPYFAALVFGAAPWTFAFVNELGADSLHAFVVSLGLLLLWRWAVAPKRQNGALFLAGCVASLPLLLRPEMIVIAPIVLGLALLLRWPPRPSDLLTVVAAFALVLTAQIAYRTWFTGEPGVFGRLAIVNRGAFHWTDTWLGTEKEAYDFVYAITEGREHPLPERAFADASERKRVQVIAERVRARGRYAQEDDAEFEKLAQERRNRSPLLVSSLRLWHTAHLWVNVENPSPLLDALAPVPRSVRRPIYGTLLLFRLILYALAAVAIVRAVVRLRRGEADAFDRLTLLAAGFIVARSLLIGAVLNWKVHRYVLAAWPPMLWCACAALRRGREELK